MISQYIIRKRSFYKNDAQSIGYVFSVDRETYLLYISKWNRIFRECGVKEFFFRESPDLLSNGGERGNNGPSPMTSVLLEIEPARWNYCEDVFSSSKLTIRSRNARTYKHSDYSYYTSDDDSLTLKSVYNEMMFQIGHNRDIMKRFSPERLPGKNSKHYRNDIHILKHLEEKFFSNRAREKTLNTVEGVEFGWMKRRKDRNDGSTSLSMKEVDMNAILFTRGELKRAYEKRNVENATSTSRAYAYDFLNQCLHRPCAVKKLENSGKGSSSSSDWIDNHKDATINHNQLPSDDAEIIRYLYEDFDFLLSRRNKVYQEIMGKYPCEYSSNPNRRQLTDKGFNFYYMKLDDTPSKTFRGQYNGYFHYFQQHNWLVLWL